MIYTVIWLAPAERDLAALWSTNPDRAAIAAAADEIDAILRKDPEQAGESRDAGRRVLFVTPLTVYFRVRTPDRIVEVGSVRYVTDRH